MQHVQYWFNEKTGEVEIGPQSLAVYRLGPFESYEEALEAPKIVLERARKIREEEED